MSQSSAKHKQREKIAQFMSLTQSNEKNAIHFLSQYDWKLDVATDAYYNSLDVYTSSGGGGSGVASSSSGSSNRKHDSSRLTIDKKKLDQMWQLYRGKFRL